MKFPAGFPDWNFHQKVDRRCLFPKGKGRMLIFLFLQKYQHPVR